MKAPSPLPEKRPAWIHVPTWQHLQEAHQTALTRYRHAKLKESEYEESKRLSELATKHYEDSLQTLTQHTIEDA